MMRKILALSLLLVFAFACTKEKDVDFSAIDKQIIEDYLKAKNLTAQTTASGLYYIISAPGGSVHPGLSSSVSAKYKGYLADGKVFDQTTTSPVTFSLGQVIKGWQEGLQLMKGGARFEFYIPAELGYGTDGQGSIPPHSVLIFDITLIESLN